VSLRGASVSPSLSPSLGSAAISICLFLPYLHFDSYKRVIRRRNVILQRLRRGRARPIPEEIAKSDSTELQVIWEFLGHDPPMNCRRTLDQYGYPSLRDTRGRDDDHSRAWPGGRGEADFHTVGTGACSHVVPP
jgi:hypothetical protein